MGRCDHHAQSSGFPSILTASVLLRLLCLPGAAPNCSNRTSIVGFGSGSWNVSGQLNAEQGGDVPAHHGGAGGSETLHGPGYGATAGTGGDSSGGRGNNGIAAVGSGTTTSTQSSRATRKGTGPAGGEAGQDRSGISPFGAVVLGIFVSGTAAAGGAGSILYLRRACVSGKHGCSVAPAKPDDNDFGQDEHFGVRSAATEAVTSTTDTRL